MNLSMACDPNTKQTVVTCHPAHRTKLLSVDIGVVTKVSDFVICSTTMINSVITSWTFHLGCFSPQSKFVKLLLSNVFSPRALGFPSQRTLLHKLPQCNFPKSLKLDPAEFSSSHLLLFILEILSVIEIRIIPLIQIYQTYPKTD